MPDYRKMFDSPYVGAWELDGDVSVEIEKVELGEVQNRDGGKDKKPIIHFSNAKKPMVLNKTNARVIARLYGNDTDDWAGRTIVLYPTKVEAFGDVTDCIRVRAEVPK